MHRIHTQNTAFQTMISSHSTSQHFPFFSARHSAWKREHHLSEKRFINKDKGLDAQKVCSRCLIWSSSRWLDGVPRIMESSSWASKSAMHYFIIKGEHGIQHCKPATQTTYSRTLRDLKARVCLKLTLSRQFPSRQLIYLLLSLRANWHFCPSSWIRYPQKPCTESWIAQPQAVGSFFHTPSVRTHCKYFLHFLGNIRRRRFCSHHK